MVQEDYFNFICRETNLNLGEFGFITGTMSPFQNKNSTQSISKSEGYEVWRRFNSKREPVKEQLRIYSSDKNHMKTVLDFLKS